MATVIRGSGGGGGQSILATIIVSLIFGAAAGYGATYFMAQRSAPAAQDREVYVFTIVLDSVNEGSTGVPHNVFVPDHIVVNKADRVTIHFYNTENVVVNHTFTMGAPYATNMVLTMGTNQNFTFTASTIGVFAYRCSYHQPTMTGYVVVLG